MDLTDFWSWVDLGGPGDCWPWRGHRHVRGYGHVRIAGRKLRAHRVAFELEVGPIPAGFNVAHDCHNPPCCNPAHLSLATQREIVHTTLDRGRLSTDRPRGRDGRFVGAGGGSWARRERTYR